MTIFLNKQRFPTVNVTPSWYVAFGKFDGLSAGVTWQDEEVAVVHTQPTFSPNQRFLVVGDIWLSNRRDVLQFLPESLSSTDTEVVTQLWEIKGVDSLKFLQGMFSLCVWDRVEKILWLARDRTGSHTLYYTKSGLTRFVAPRLATLAPHHSQELDFVALRDYLCCAFVPGERTLWQDVRELRPGMVLEIAPLKHREHKAVFWQGREEIHNAQESLAWHGKELKGLLNEVVQEYLPQQEPVGVYLSGGLDSSCITALAAKFHNHPVHTYSIHFGADCPNELEFSNLVAQHCQTQHHILEITAKDMWEKLPLTLAHLDNPIGDPLTVPNYLLGQIAKENSQVILNGEGGDPCFGGPKNQPMLLNQLYGAVHDFDTDIVSAYLASFQKCALNLAQLLKPEVFAAVQEEKSVFADDLYSDRTYLNKLMLLNIKFKGADNILTKVNNLTRAHGLRGRSPLFDQRLVEKSLQIPPEYKLAGVQEKAVLKNAVADVLPLTILQRPKSGMMVPVQLWCKTVWQRRARSLLLNKKAAIAPYLNQTLIREWLDYRGDAWSRYGVKLWLLITLEIWLQVHRGE